MLPVEMLLYRTPAGAVVSRDGACFAVPGDWDDLLNDEALPTRLRAAGDRVPAPAALLAPVGTQEIWAAGVTYWRSRTARMEEASAAGGGSFYDRVYEAPRPELFFKANPHRVAAPGAPLRLRPDARWIVPEPELTLVIDRRARIVGYTVGNDLSCRDIEGENPLYLPQAKTFDGCVALGPGLLITDQPLPPETPIALQIVRDGRVVVDDATTLAQLRRQPAELVEYLYRAASFPSGAFLLTGTGIVPAESFSLEPGDDVRITIPPIGTLVNPVA